MSESQPSRSITISDDGFDFPIVELLTGRTFISGKSGSGKSNTISVIAEELLDKQYPMMIVDTDGEYWGLKEEYEILHVGGDSECDLIVGPEHAEKLAELALEQNVPIILDVSGYLEEDVVDDLLRETAKYLFAKEKKLKRPFLLIVEECHEYIPESKKTTDAGKMLIKIGKRGRKHGLGICGLSQRPANVKKDFITQCDLLFWHRLTWETDTKTVKRVLGNEYEDRIQKLSDGEAFVTADFLDIDVEKVQVRRKRTYDAGATPDLGDVDRPDLESVSGDIVEELEAISDRESQRQDRISQLEAENDELREQIDELEQELSEARDLREMADTFATALQEQSGDNGDSGEADHQITELIEERNELQRELEARKEHIDELEAEVSELQGVKEELAQLESVDFETAEEAITRLADALEMDVGGDTSKWKQKAETEREKRKEVEAELRDRDTESTDDGTSYSESTGVSVIPDNYREFVEHEYIQQQVEAAKNTKNVSPSYVTAVMKLILQRGGPVTRREVADDVGIKTPQNIGKAMRALSDQGVVELSGKGNQQTADFAFDTAQNQQQAEAVVENAGL